MDDKQSLLKGVKEAEVPRGAVGRIRCLLADETEFIDDGIWAVK